MLWNNPLYCVNICCCDWFNKEADWSIAGQDKVRRENQTKDIGKKKGGVREVTSLTWRGNRRYKMKEMAILHGGTKISRIGLL